jgi:hypothetical protein
LSVIAAIGGVINACHTEGPIGGKASGDFSQIFSSLRSKTHNSNDYFGINIALVTDDWGGWQEIAHDQI